MWDRGLLPHWTGSAPPPEEPVDTTEITSGPASPERNAIEIGNAAATDPALNPAPAATEPPAPAEVEAPAPAPAEETAPAPAEKPTPSQPEPAPSY